jgi:GAF domain-containing protein
MQPAPLPVDEDARLAAVRRYDVLDTPPDGAFDRITALAARICHVPISTITIVDEDRIWFKSTHGIEVDEIGRDPGLCASAVIEFEPYVVTDAATDARAMDNPLVRGELGLRFYVGVPLTTADGYRLGTLNVIDVAPREISDDELAHLEDLAAIVVDELELRLAARRSVADEAAREAAEFRETLMDGISHEMRTPISVLQGIVGLDPDDADLAVGDLQRMMGRHVLHLEWLVNQYLDFTQLEAGREPHLSAEPLDLAEVADRLPSSATRTSRSRSSSSVTRPRRWPAAAARCRSSTSC